MNGNTNFASNWSQREYFVKLHNIILVLRGASRPFKSYPSKLLFIFIDIRCKRPTDQYKHIDLYAEQDMTVFLLSHIPFKLVSSRVTSGDKILKRRIFFIKIYLKDPSLKGPSEGGSSGWLWSLKKRRISFFFFVFLRWLLLFVIIRNFFCV